MKHFLAPIFSSPPFSPHEQQLVIEAFKPVHKLKGEHLVVAGEVNSFYWFMENGLARSYVINQNGEEITTAFYLEGDIVMNWTAFFSRQPALENTVLAQDAKLWELDYQAFQKLFHSVAPFREAGRNRLVEAFFALKSHHLSMHTESAKNRYLHLLHTQPRVIQNFPLKQIASYLGITDSSLSRIRKTIAHE